MTSKWLFSFISGIALIGMTLTSALPASAEQAPDKSGPGVTRVSVVQGSVVVQRGDSNKQVAAVVNAPLLPGDYISTGASSRGEVQFDGGTAVRLGGNVQARITNDDPNNRQLQLADGTIEVGVVRQAGPVQVDTPSVTVRARDSGDYRISIGRDGASWITVRRGTADIVTPQRTYTLDSGRTLVARGSASDPSITYTTAVGFDSFDDFNAKRDQTMVAAIQASPDLNPDIAGYDNLGAYGQWQNVPGYGQSWVPQQTANWAPYSDGSWTWEDGYGWTWVGNEPWGWTPYHYGNWYYANGYGWAWAPPAYSAYPSWSPALVGFFGFGVGGAGWGLSVGFGYPYIGWYPVAPYAPFYSWWPGWAWRGVGWGWGGWGCCGWRGWGGNVYNISRVTNITNINRYYAHGGIHGTSISNFQHGQISGHTFNVTPRQVAGHAGLIHGAVPVTPSRDNLGFGGRSVGAPVTLSKAFDSSRFASANHTLAASRTSFDDQQRDVAHAISSNSAHSDAPVSRSGDRTGASGDRTGASGDRIGASSDHSALTSNRESTQSSSWDRFNQARGTEERNGSMNRSGSLESRYARSDSGLSSRSESSFGRSEAPSERSSDPWSRFSSERGNGSTAAYSRGESSARDTYGNSYDRSSYDRGSSQRNPYASSSYARGSSYSSYSRGSSYPSYARGSSYPSYSRGSSYSSYSRGSSYPSYSRGSSYSSPSYSRGGSQPSYHSGGSAAHPSGGGGNGGSHGGRPPHS